MEIQPIHHESIAAQELLFCERGLLETGLDIPLLHLYCLAIVLPSWG
jgi:hypothetical protein